MGSFTNVIVHLVFGTRRRRPWIQSGLRGRMHEYMGGVLRANGWKAIEIGGVEDHVHLLVRMPADGSFGTIVRELKLSSLSWTKKCYPEIGKPRWQGGYSAFSVNSKKLDGIRNYIRNQEVHHRSRSFREEYESLLKSNGIEYDPRHLFDRENPDDADD